MNVKSFSQSMNFDNAFGRCSFRLWAETSLYWLKLKADGIWDRESNLEESNSAKGIGNAYDYKSAFRNVEYVFGEVFAFVSVLACFSIGRACPMCV